MKELVIYVHGKGRKAEEVEHYRLLFPKSDVIGFDYKSQNPWEVKIEFSDFYDLNTEGYDSVIIIANNIGVFCSMMPDDFDMENFTKEEFLRLVRKNTHRKVFYSCFYLYSSGFSGCFVKKELTNYEQHFKSLSALSTYATL